MGENDDARDKGWYTICLNYAYIYGNPDRLYLNVTNRCTNRCSFCVRYFTDGLGGALLWGKDEPDLDRLKSAILERGPFEEIREFVWCGFGEPTFRMDLIQAASSWLGSAGATIRLNTNGHACLIHGRDVLPDLAQSVDEVSISLNAPNKDRYLELCRPDMSLFGPWHGQNPRPEFAWEAMLDFLSRSPSYFKKVQASVVGFVLTNEEVEACRSLALSLGVKAFRVR